MPPLITPADRIFVAGHRGMAGSAFCRALQRPGYSNLLTASRAELDLEDGRAVQCWEADAQTDAVLILTEWTCFADLNWQQLAAPNAQTSMAV